LDKIREWLHVGKHDKDGSRQRFRQDLVQGEREFADRTVQEQEKVREKLDDVRMIARHAIARLERGRRIDERRAKHRGADSQ